MGAQTPENKAKARVLTKLNTRKQNGEPIYWICFAGSQFGTAGLDILICYRGQFIAVEVKRFDGKGKLTKRQILTLGQIATAEGATFVVDSEEALTRLDDFLTNLKNYLMILRPPTTTGETL